MSNQKQYLRFSLARRIEHWVNFAAFFLLALTGLPQKYPNAGLSGSVFNLFGGLENVRLVHRGAAVALMLIVIWHAGKAIHHWLVLRGPLSMLLNKDDAVNAYKAVRYNLKLSDEKPHQGFYTFEEKAEYYALLWGTAVMIVTGFFLWNPITASNWFPGGWIPAAKAAHGGEALLAVLAILLWHFYHVLVKHFNKSMFTGTMSQHEMEEYHPAALEEDWAPPATDDPARKRRETFFYGSYGIAALLMLLGVYWFVTTETTALAQPEEVPDLAAVESYVPLDAGDEGFTLPEANTERYGSTWDDGISAFIDDNCVACHNGPGTIADLDLSTHEGALKGAHGLPAVIPGQPGASPLVIWPQREDHPVHLNSDEIAALMAWIANGAP